MLSRIFHERRAFLLSQDPARARLLLIPFNTSVPGAAASKPAAVAFNSPADYETIILAMDGCCQYQPEVDVEDEQVNASRVLVSISGKPLGVPWQEAPFIFGTILGSYKARFELETPWRIGPNGSLEVQYETLVGFAPSVALATRTIAITMLAYQENTKLLPNEVEYEAGLIGIVERAKRVAAVMLKDVLTGKR